MNEKERLSEEAIANKRRYDAEYLKENYGQLAISLPKQELKDIKRVIKDNGLTNSEFLRLCVKLLKEGKIKKED